jgi:hypothetical protein
MIRAGSFWEPAKSENLSFCLLNHIDSHPFISFCDFLNRMRQAGELMRDLLSIFYLCEITIGNPPFIMKVSIRYYFLRLEITESGAKWGFIPTKALSQAW